MNKLTEGTPIFLSPYSKCLFYIDNDNVIQKTLTYPQGVNPTMAVELFHQFGYTTKALKYIIEEYLLKYCGKQYDELIVALCQAKERREKYEAAYKKLPEYAKDYICRFDKEIVVHGSGFNVYVSMLSRHSFEEVKEFVKNNKKLFLEFVSESIKENPRMMKKIGALAFYRPDYIMIMRNHMVEVKFSIKTA